MLFMYWKIVANFREIADFIFPVASFIFIHRKENLRVDIWVRIELEII